MSRNNNESSSMVIKFRIKIGQKGHVIIPELDYGDKPTNHYLMLTKVIASHLLFEKTSPLYGQFKNLYSDDYNQLESTDNYETRKECRKKVLNKVNPIEVVSRYIDYIVKDQCDRFIDENYLKNEDLKVKVSDVEFSEGCLLTTFDLLIKTFKNINTVYGFISRLVDHLMDDEFLLDAGSVTVSAVPNTSSNVNDSKKLGFGLKTSIIALIVSILTLVFVLIGGYVYDDKLRKSIMNDTEELIKKETPEMIKESLYREKVDLLFYREATGLPPQVNQNDSSKLNKSK